MERRWFWSIEWQNGPMAPAIFLGFFNLWWCRCGCPEHTHTVFGRKVPRLFFCWNLD